MNKIKKATVQILIDSTNYTGTGFYIDEIGTIVTCWHVIQPALNSIKFKKILVKNNEGEILEFGILPGFFKDSSMNFDAVAYDFCILTPLKRLKKNTQFLKIGNFDKAYEGEEVITCGYPLGLPQQFISKGIISTKYIDSSKYIFTGKSRNKVLTKTSVALLDLTMNRGNSGGAIIKMGETIDKDEVIGIADFIINPIASKADSLINTFNSAGGVQIQGIDPNATFSFLTETLTYMSIGISGCVSINNVNKWLKDK